MNPHGNHGGAHGGAHGGPQHYQPYPDLASPHSPAPDTSPFNGHPAGGPNNPGGNPNAPHHSHHHMESHHPHQHPVLGGPHHHHHNHHHHLNNNNNNNNNSTTNNNNNSVVKTCGGCGGKIVERYLLHALDRYWHHGCLKCTCCGGQLADLGASCFTKAGMILCKTDYARIFGNTGACAACGQTIPASEFVMRVGGGPSAPQPGAPRPQRPCMCFTSSASRVPSAGRNWCPATGTTFSAAPWCANRTGTKSSRAAPGAWRGPRLRRACGRAK